MFFQKTCENIIEILFICKPMAPHHSEAWEDLWNHVAIKPTQKRKKLYQVKKDIAWAVSDMLDVAREQQNPTSYKTKEYFFFHNIDSIITYLIRTGESDDSWEIIRKWAERYGLWIGDVNAIILYKNTLTRIKNQNAWEYFRKSCLEINAISKKQNISFDDACRIYWNQEGKKKYKDWKITRLDGLTAASIPFLLLMQIVRKYELGDKSS